jgi:hypothetical protein
MKTYFYIAPLINSEHFKLGISRDSIQNLFARLSLHKSGFKNHGYDIDEEQFEYIEFQGRKHAGFIEYHIKRTIQNSPICRYGGTETFHNSKLEEIKRIAENFSQDYDGSGFQRIVKDQTSKGNRKKLSDIEKIQRKEKIELNRIKRNLENFTDFDKWFEKYKSRIIVRPFSNYSNKIGDGISLNEFVLDFDLTGLPDNYKDGLGYVRWYDFLCYEKKDGHDIDFLNAIVPFSAHNKQGQFYYKKENFNTLRSIDPDFWEMLPIEIKKQLELDDNEIIKEWLLKTKEYPIEIWWQKDRAYYEKLESDSMNY